MATIKDVAKAAGVSTATVSRIINGKGEASPETIQRVNKVIEELDYRPNSVAKSLSKKQSNLIALLIPNLRNPYFSQLVEAIESAANQRGYQLYLCNTDDDREKVAYYLEKVKDNYVAGAIINSLFVTEPDLAALERQGIKTITIDRTNVTHPYASVTVDHVYGGYLAAKHLILDCGCERLLFVGGSEDHVSSNDRKEGLQQAMEEFGGEVSGLLNGDFRVQGGYDAITEYLQKNPRTFDGVFCANDAMAIGVLRGLQDQGIEVPKDVQVIGYDSLAIGEFLNPRLSSVDQHTKKAASLIINEIENGSKEQVIGKYSLRPELVLRGSTTPL